MYKFLFLDRFNWLDADTRGRRTRICQSQLPGAGVVLGITPVDALTFDHIITILKV